MEILDGLETLCIGAVLGEALREPQSRYTEFEAADTDDRLLLANARERNELMPEKCSTGTSGDFWRESWSTTKIEVPWPAAITDPGL